MCQLFEPSTTSQEVCQEGAQTSLWNFGAIQVLCEGTRRREQKDKSSNSSPDRPAEEQEFLEGRNISVTEESPKSIFLLSKRQCLEFIEEAAAHERLTASLMKNYDVISPEYEDDDDPLLLRMLCEYYMCNVGLKEMLKNFEESRPVQYNEEREEYDYIVTKKDGASLQLIITATDVLKLELENFNISFTVH